MKWDEKKMNMTELLPLKVQPYTWNCANFHGYLCFCDQHRQMKHSGKQIFFFNFVLAAVLHDLEKLSIVSVLSSFIF